MVASKPGCRESITRESSALFTEHIIDKMLLSAMESLLDTLHFLYFLVRHMLPKGRVFPPPLA